MPATGIFTYTARGYLAIQTTPDIDPHNGTMDKSPLDRDRRESTGKQGRCMGEAAWLELGQRLCVNNAASLSTAWGLGDCSHCETVFDFLLPPPPRPPHLPLSLPRYLRTRRCVVLCVNYAVSFQTLWDCSYCERVLDHFLCPPPPTSHLPYPPPPSLHPGGGDSSVVRAPDS